MRRAVVFLAAMASAYAALPTVLLVGPPKFVAEEAHKQNKHRFQLVTASLAAPDANKTLWRWIAMQAPDLVVVAGTEDYGLADALTQDKVVGVGRIPAMKLPEKAGILQSLPKEIPMSEAHREIDRRRARTPRQVADELSKYYGHDFADVIYIPTIALIGQLRLGNLAEVQRLVEPFVNGSKNSLARPTSLHLAGHLIFGELATRTGDPRYLELVRRVANLGFTEQGEMKVSMPFHDEMSDSFFMACPIVAKAGALTGERKYFDMAARHFDFMQKLDLRPDGIYRHSPLTDAAWGRGNAFPALGLALTLSSFPKTHPDFARLQLAFQQHMAALAKFQTSEGLWREVIDQPGSYQEFSATAMIGTAMLMGIRQGWLDAKAYQPRVDQAWRAVAARVGSNGWLVDVCESTNKQKTLDDYLHRVAILGPDPRGGAMALLFATEMAGLR